VAKESSRRKAAEKGEEEHALLGKVADRNKAKKDEDC